MLLIFINTIKGVSIFILSLTYAYIMFQLKCLSHGLTQSLVRTNEGAKEAIPNCFCFEYIDCLRIIYLNDTQDTKKNSLIQVKKFRKKI